MTSKPPINDPDRPEWELQKAVEETQQMTEKREKRKSRFEELFQEAANLIADRLSETVREVMQASEPATDVLQPSELPEAVEPRASTEDAEVEFAASESLDLQFKSEFAAAGIETPSLQADPIFVQSPDSIQFQQADPLVVEPLTDFAVPSLGVETVAANSLPSDLPAPPSPIIASQAGLSPAEVVAASPTQTPDLASEAPAAAQESLLQETTTPKASAPVVAPQRLPGVDMAAAIQDEASQLPQPADRGLPPLPFGLTPAMVGISPEQVRPRPPVPDIDVPDPQWDESEGQAVSYQDTQRSEWSPQVSAALADSGDSQSDFADELLLYLSKLHDKFVELADSVRRLSNDLDRAGDDR